MEQRLRALTMSLCTLVLAGCSEAAPAVTTVTVTASAASAVSPPRLQANAREVFATASDSDCSTSTDQVLVGSTAVTLLNSGSGFVTLSIRPSNATTPEADVYRLSDVGPGATAAMTVRLVAGSYSIVCTGVSRAIAAARPLLVS